MVQEISAIEDNENGIRPVIVQFQNSELQEGEEKNLKIGLYKKSKHENLVAVATKKMLYLGSIDKKKEKNDLYNRFLLVSNRKTGKVRLVAVDTAVVTAQFEQKENDIRDNVDTSISNLNKQFGSKKIKRITEQRERLKMNVEDVKEQLEQTVAGVVINENESFVVDATNSESLYKPPINRNASTKEQVYVLQELVPDVVLDSLEEEVNNVLSSDLDTLELCDLVKHQLEELQNSSSSNVQKCKLLLLLDYLIKFLQKPAKSVTKKLVICSASEANNYILNNFSVATNTGRARPVSYRDKTICYILVLAMLIFDYEINIEELAKNVKLSVKKLQDVGKVLAFSAGKSKNVMVLKLPLPSPVSTSPRKRKRT